MDEILVDESGSKGKMINMVTLSWWPATTGISQHSTSPTALFQLFIRGLNAGLKYILSKFPEDTKLKGAVNSSSRVERLCIQLLTN